MYRRCRSSVVAVAAAAVLVATSSVYAQTASRGAHVSVIDHERGISPAFFEARNTPGYPYVSHIGESRVLLGDAGPVAQRIYNESYGYEVFFEVLLEGAGPAQPTAEGVGGTFNYYRGDDPSLWLEGIGSYQRVRYAGIYPGIDLEVAGEDGQFVYRFTLAPGVTLEPLVLACSSTLYADEEGVIRSEDAVFEARPPVVRQETPAGPVEFVSSMRLLDDRRCGFVTPEGLDGALETVVEYRLGLRLQNAFRRFYNGCNSVGTFRGRVVTLSSAPAVAAPAPDTGMWLGGGEALIVTAMKGNGQIEWCTVIDGMKVLYDGYSFMAQESGNGLSIAPDGSVWVTGSTTSVDFPLVSPFQAEYGGQSINLDAVVVRLDLSGRVVFSSYLGSWGTENAFNISADAGGAWIAGTANLSSFPMPDYTGPRPTTTGTDAFVARITNDGEYTWGYCLATDKGDYGRGVAGASQTEVWVTGYSQSPSFPVVGGFDATFAGTSEAFVARLSTTQGLLWSTFLGGDGQDIARDIAVDRRGNAWVTGYTRSADFPVVGGFDTEPIPGATNAFLAKFGPSGTFDWCGFIGGENWNQGLGVSIDRRGEVWVSGSGNGPDGEDSFVTSVSRNGRLRSLAFFPSAESEVDPPLSAFDVVAVGRRAWVACGVK